MPRQSNGMIRKLADKMLVRPISFLRRHSGPTYGLFDELDRRVAGETADYVQKNMRGALAFRTKEPLWDFALSKVSNDGMFAEFGVFNGRSINHIAATLSRLRGRPVPIFGFDSFEGLHEDWGGTTCPKGTFDLGGKLPEVPGNVTLIKGWFDQTLPTFLKEHPGPFAFVHVDCDTYEAARILFDLIGDRIVAGTVMIFDEYFGYLDWQNGEFKVWQDFVQSNGVKYRYLGFSGEQAAVKIEARK